MSVPEFIFRTSLACVAYALVIYPCAIYLLAQRRRDARSGTRSAFDGHDVADNDAEHHFTSPSRPAGMAADADPAAAQWPLISLIVLASADERLVLDRLKEMTLLDYPSDKLDFIVGWCGQEDLTGDLVRSYFDSAVETVQLMEPDRYGAVLNQSIAQARGEIIVLSDAKVSMPASAVRRLAAHFRDETVGGVCGQLVSSDALAKPWSPRRWFRDSLNRHEGFLGYLLDTNEGLFAFRKHLYRPMPQDASAAHFLIGCDIHLQGHRVLLDAGTVARKAASSTTDLGPGYREQIRKGVCHKARRLLPLLNPLSGPIAAVAWSDLVAQRLLPVLLLAAILSNVLLSSDPIYLRLLLLHETVYLAIVIGLFVVHSTDSPLRLWLNRQWGRFVGIRVTRDGSGKSAPFVKQRPR